MDLATFAESRGFTEDELTEFGIRWEAPHIVIPLLGRNGIWHERIRCDAGCHPKYWQQAGLSSHLWNPLGLGPHSEEVWLAEGELDCLSLVCSGVAAVGVLGAGNFNRHWALLFEGAEIVIAFDSDEKGNESAEKLAQLWPQGQVSRFDPHPHLDLNDWFKADREGFTEAVTGW